MVGMESIGSFYINTKVRMQHVAERVVTLKRYFWFEGFNCHSHFSLFWDLTE